MALRSISVCLFFIRLGRCGYSEKLFVVSGEALKMRRHRSCDQLRLFYFKEMPDDLSVVGGLPGQALHWVSLRKNFSLVHDLNLLRRLRGIFERTRQGRNRAVHQLRPRIEGVVQKGREYDSCQSRASEGAGGFNPPGNARSDVAFRRGLLRVSQALREI
jgi:hypothetical protein